MPSEYKLHCRNQTRNVLAANVEASLRLTAGLKELSEPLGRAAEILAESFLGGGKLLCCGNGGSAADSAHVVAEFVGRFLIERPGFPAVDLSANNCSLTALVNDYPAEQVFARQVQALGQEGDVLMGFTTSGNSTNIRLALEVAGAKRMKRIAFLGRGGGACKGLAEVDLIVPSQSTPRIQEAHQFLFHALCEVLDPILAGK